MRWAWLLAPVAAGAILLWWLGGRVPPTPPSSDSDKAPPPSGRAEFTGSARCRSCHEDEHAAWRVTAHARALRPPDAATGAFDGKPVAESTPRRSGRNLVVQVEERDNRVPGNHRVTWVVGGRSAELYLFTDSRGAWRVVPIAWRVAAKAWEETREVYGALTGDPAPGDVRQIIFNRDCAACHTTRFDPGFRPDPAGGDSYQSTFADASVGCEACHGPGSVHAAWHEEKRPGAYEAPAKLKRGGAGACLRCHYAHEFRFALPDDPDVPFAEVAVSRNFDGFGFFPDGRLSADRHAGTTFVQSACARGGATCLSCHAVHGGEAKPKGDALCTGCHEGLARRDHTFHEDVRCVDCHMPRLLEAPLDGLRDHSLRSPEPALTERFGIPNACNACHRDKGSEWARESKEKWWGPADERRLFDAGLVAALREGDVAPDRLAEAVRDPRSPLFSRATALRALPRGHPAVREALLAAEIDLVQVACEALAERPDPLAAGTLVDLLRHPARTVRVEAAHALARGGWRAAQPWPEIHSDARALLGRQAPVPALLVRAAWILDAFGAPDEMAILLPEVVRRVPDEAAALVERRGRDLADAGHHSEALLAYDDARKLYGEPLPPLLYIDSADSVAATGDAPAATTIWEHAVERAEPGSVEHTIARARLTGGEEGAALLRPVAARLEADLLGAEMLRRVRWSLHALEHTAAR